MPFFRARYTSGVALWLTGVFLSGGFLILLAPGDQHHTSSGEITDEFYGYSASSSGQQEQERLPELAIIPEVLLFSRLLKNSLAITV